MDSIVNLSTGVDRVRVGRECDCPTWGLLDWVERDRLLAGLTEWSWLFHRVRVKLLVHAENVGVHELRVLRPGWGQARKVMSELCLFADCSRVVLELTPTDEFGADLGRLRRFYASLGFESNHESVSGFVWRGSMIRDPVKGRRHGQGE